MKYGADPRILRETITRAVRSVESVQSDQPVEVIFQDFSEATMRLRVRWWCALILIRNGKLIRVTEAIYLALKEIQIETT